MKKLISYFLIFALFVTTMPVQIFAQDLAYKPAMSFEYDYYKIDKISPEKFIENLEKDLLNDEDFYAPNSVALVSKELEGTPEHLRQSYNDFLYYSIYPEESPLWSYTGLKSGNGTSEADVLKILDKHKTLSEEITEHLKQNPKYKKSVFTKLLRVPAHTVIFDLMNPSLISDEISKIMDITNKNLDLISQWVSLYKNYDIQVDLLKPIQETEYGRIEKELDEKLKGSLKSISSEDTLLLKKYFKEGYASIEDSDKPNLKKILGQFLYDVFDGDENLINEYFRKELLRTYYALEFINDELKSDDPLKYNRAMIDLTTTYKVQYIQIIDNRNKRTEEQLNQKLASQTGVAKTYQTMLTRAEVNYLVQLMDISKKLKDKERIKEIQKSLEKRIGENSKNGYSVNNETLEKFHGEYYNFSGTK